MASCLVVVSAFSSQAARRSKSTTGLMEVKDDKRRVRLFDLTDFGLLDAEPRSEPPAKR